MSFRKGDFGIARPRGNRHVPLTCFNGLTAGVMCGLCRDAEIMRKKQEAAAAKKAAEAEAAKKAGASKKSGASKKPGESSSAPPAK
jgi:hypothetical protein